MDGMKRQKALRKYRLQSAAICAACLILTVAMAFVISGVKLQDTSDGIASPAASIFANNSTLGYIVIALLAFCVGTLVTILCYRLKQHLGEKEDDRKS